MPKPESGHLAYHLTEGEHVPWLRTAEGFEALQRARAAAKAAARKREREQEKPS